MNINEQLAQLEQARDAGRLSPAEFDRLKAKLLDGFTQSPEPPVAGAAQDYTPADETRLASLSEGLEIGPDDDRYRLVRKIGGGGMGHVWLAHDLNLEQRRGGDQFKALKVIHPQLQDQKPALERLKDEADRAALLNHEHIVNVLGWRQGRDGWLFVVMEYLPGRNLDEYLHEQGGQGLEPDRLRRLLPPIARALDYAHAHQVLHRDLKPANVFLTDADEVKLLDFGLAAELHSSASSLKITDAGGTCEYMSPQAHHGGVPSAAEDIYALACVACQLLTGRPPLTCMAAVNRGPGPLPKPDQRLSDPVWAVLQQGLAYAPKDRPAGAKAFSDALLAALDPGARTAGRTSERPDPRPRRWWIGAAAAGLLGGGVLFWQLGKDEAAPADPAEARDARLWQQARERNSIDGYQGYRDGCERCAKDEAAEQAIARLRAEVRERDLIAQRERERADAEDQARRAAEDKARRDDEARRLAAKEQARKEAEAERERQAEQQRKLAAAEKARQGRAERERWEQEANRLAEQEQARQAEAERKRRADEEQAAAEEQARQAAAREAREARNARQAQDRRQYEGALAAGTERALRDYLASCRGTGCVNRDQAKAALRRAEALRDAFAGHLAADRLSSGAGGTAADTLAEYRELLPNDPFVKQGGERIARRYLELARSALDRGRADEARGYVEKGEGFARLDGLADLRKELDVKPRIAEPDMVSIPGGRFQMGCVSGKGCYDDEKPVHWVTLKPFKIGKYEVTFDDWDACVAAGGCSHRPKDYDWGRGKRPVVDVSWYHVQEYVAWLNRQTGKRYRLPTEAEWEYAARAGTDTPYWFGGCIDTDQANYDGNYDWNGCGQTGVYHRQTLPVDSFQANPRGLYNVHGNVWEWVQDCWHDNYKGAPEDGSAWEENCSGAGRRVLRGGSWDYEPGYLRAAERGGGEPGGRRSVSVGFRLAQD